MAGYIVYWPQDRVKELQKAGDTGPIKVVLGSIHSRMPTIVSVKVGDIVFPVTLIKKRLCVLARLPVERREPALNYLIRELGQAHGALLPEGTALENSINGNSRYWSNIGGKYSYRQQRSCRRGPPSSPWPSRWKSPTKSTRSPLTAAPNGRYRGRAAPPSGPGRFRRSWCLRCALATPKARSAPFR